MQMSQAVPNRAIQPSRIHLHGEDKNCTKQSRILAGFNPIRDSVDKGNLSKLNFVPDSIINSMSLQQYGQFNPVQDKGVNAFAIGR